ncbi:hypothetical protein AMS68_001735 [Peltaster fructicola]|uniref:Golgi apparatus membrane protein TVP38 n=1 Tax=Peltaster fructicola TaxID=286661 RepID=A0A6H0XNM1_9PEZI|nr:hypothetical protein AMS68_001735 [Peltaster fructicola]
MAADNAARVLSMSVEESDEHLLPTSHRTSISPAGWRRRSPASAISDRPRTARDKWFRSARRLRNKGQALFFSLTPLQRAGLIILNIVLLVSLILFAVFNEQIFHKITPIAKSWSELPGGWMILWAVVVVVSFPPMIGYSSCVMIAGFVWGMHGWLIIASASIVGSTLAFVVSRTVLKRFVSRLTEKNKRFAALALVLKHDGLKLLTMIRLCPLPYSLSNGAISTIPTVTWYNLMLATTIASPKLLLHVFIGKEIRRLADSNAKMSAGTKAVSYISITLGTALGIAVGYFIYIRTKARAAELEAEEAAAVLDGRNDYNDDPAEREAINTLKQNDNATIALSEGEDVEHGYRDSFSNDEDAEERDVFDLGDGGSSDEDDNNR